MAFFWFVWCVCHILAGSIIFDFVHRLAHSSYQSVNPALRVLSKAHSYHHRFFDQLTCQICGTFVSWLLKILYCRQRTTLDISLALGFACIRSLIVAINGCYDSNHLTYSKLPKDPQCVFVGPEYHALHHMEPGTHFASMIRVVDWVLGTSVTLNNRRITLTGSRGAFGQALLRQFEKEDVACVNVLRYGVEWTYDDYSKLYDVLRTTDILVLAHGSKTGDTISANCTSATVFIETFKRARRVSDLSILPEIWYVGSEAELHGSWSGDSDGYTISKREFAHFARGYYDDPTFIYRHIVPASFQSKMGRSMVSAHRIAIITFWWIKRGARYVPATYTGLAYINYIRFMLSKAQYVA